MGCFLSTLKEWQPLAIFISALGTVGLGFVAVYQDWLRRSVYCPELDLGKGPFYPDYEKVALENQKTGDILGKACYLQIRVENNGPSSAEKVEVFIAKLEKEIDGVFCKVKEFYPLNLKWRHYDTIYLDRLSPETGRDCTLGRITDPKYKKEVGDDYPSLKLPHNMSPFRLELGTTPSTRSDLLTPGKYRLFLEIGASNSRRPKKQTIELEFTGNWLPNPVDMAKATLV